MFNHGISKTGDMLELGVAAGIVKKAGAFYSYGETKLGQGRENAKEFLTQHPEIAQSIEARVRGETPSLGKEAAGEEAAGEAILEDAGSNGATTDGPSGDEAITPGSSSSGPAD